jgi:predicted dinucleotide-binding enzyme
MKVGVMGTGMVGRSHAARLVEKGHEAMIGTRDPVTTLAETKRDYMGNPPFAVWRESNQQVGLGTFAEAAAFGELIINATLGSASLAALALAGTTNLAGKILVDISEPLDFSAGPGLFTTSTESLGEQIQRAFPDARVVKTLNTVTASLQVNPMLLANGEHDVFLSGNDPEAKSEVAGLLGDVYGWTRIIDLGDITTSRGTEMMIIVWLTLFGTLKTPLFNYRVMH